MILLPAARKLALTLHVVTSVGFLGAVASFLALSIVGLLAQEQSLVAASYIAMDIVTWTVIMPLGVASFLSGLVSSLGTPWGLFRYYWVLIKLVLTLLSLALLLVHTQPIGAQAEAAALGLVAEGGAAARLQLTAAAAAGLITIVLMTALSVYKPRGLTRYGWRKQQEAA